MFDLAIVGPRIKPEDTHVFVDVLHVWFRSPPTGKEMRQLRQHCGALLTGRAVRVAEPAAFDARYQATLRFCQPDEWALQWLAKRNDVLLTYAEFARDLITPEYQELLGIFSRHFVQRWHRKRECRLWENGNYRTGRRGQPGVWFQFYADRHCKITGEVECFHAEARVQGSAALRRIGINHPRDLLTFDHAGFWQGNLALLKVDRTRLGRWWRNKLDGTRRQTPIITKSGYDLDRATGNLLCRVYGRDAFGNTSMQALVDNLGRGPHLHSMLSANTILLPNPHSANTILVGHSHV